MAEPNQYIIPVGIGGAELEAGFTSLFANLQKLAALGNQSNETVQAGFRDTAKASTDLEGKLEKQAAEYVDIRKNIEGLEYEMKQFIATQQKAFEGKIIGQYQAQIKRLEQVIAELQETGKKTGQGVTDQFRKIGETAKQLYTQMDNLQERMSKLDPNSKEFARLNKELEAATLGIKQLEGEGGDLDARTQTLKANLKEMVQVMAQLKRAGLDDTVMYKELRKQAGELKDTIGDVNEEIALAGSDTSGFDNVLRTATTLGGVFNIGASSMALFGEESEETQKRLLKLNAAMGILQGLQAVQAELARKDSIATKAAAQAQELYALAVGTSTGAMKAFKTALLATGIGALIIGLGLLIANFDEVTEAVGEWLGVSSEATKQAAAMTAVNLKAAESYATEVAEINVLLARYKQAGDDRQLQAKIMEDLKKKSESYFGALKDEGEELANVERATKDYLEAMKLVATAKAAMELYTETVKKELETQAKALTDNVGFWESSWNFIKNGGQSAGYAVDQVTSGLENQIETVKKAQEEGKKYLGIYSNAQLNLDIMGGDPKGQDDALSRAKQQVAAEQALRNKLAEIQNQINDSRIAAMRDGIVKDRATLNERYRQVIEGVKQEIAAENLRIENDKKLSLAEVALLKETNIKRGQLLVALRKEQLAELSNLNEKHNRGEAEKELQAINTMAGLTMQLTQLKNEALDEGYNKTLAVLQAENAAKIQAIDQDIANAKLELKYNKDLTEEETENIRKQQEERNKIKQQLIANGNTAELKLQTEHNKAVLALNLQAESDLIAMQVSTTANEVTQVNINYQQKIAALRETYKDYPDKLAQLEAAALDEKNRVVKQIETNAALQRIQTQEELATRSIDLMKLSGGSETEFEQYKQVTILGIQKKFASERIAELRKQYGLEQQLSHENIKAITNKNNLRRAAENGQSIFEFLGIKFDEIPEDQRAAAEKNLLDWIETLQTKVKTKAKDFSLAGIAKSWFSSLGLSDEDAELVVNAWSDAINNIMSAYTASIQQQIEEKQRYIDTLSSQIDEVESELDRELGLQEKGYANNVDAKQKELAELKRQREQALKEKQEIQKKEEAVQRAEIVIDSLSQISNLITASTQIFEAFSSIPYVGIPLAIATIAAMFGAFAYAKVQAFNSVGSRAEKGMRVAKGNRHKDGGNKYVSMDGNDADILEIEEGEWVVNRKSSDKYNNVLKAINQDNFNELGLDDAGLRHLLAGTGVTFTKKAKSKANANFEKANVVNNMVANVSFGNAKYLEEIAENTEYLAEAERNRETSEVLPNGHVIKRYKGGSRTIIPNPNI